MEAIQTNRILGQFSLYHMIGEFSRLAMGATDKRRLFSADMAWHARG
jgi:hypothetical protein